VSLEERVVHLEDKLDEVIELLKFMIKVDTGITNDATNLLVSHLDKLTED
jgi:hypothetical protein